MSDLPAWLAPNAQVGTQVMVPTLDGREQRMIAGNVAAPASPLTPQPHALEFTQIVDPQNVTGVATSTGANTATVHDIAARAYTARVWSTFRDLVAAWATLTPLFGAPVNIVFASSHTDANDPVAGFAPITEGFVRFIGALPPGAVATTITGVVGKSRGAGINSALMAVGPTAKGQYIVNATHPSVAWSHRLATGSLSIHIVSQPMVETFSGPTPAEVDAWTEDDAVHLYEPVAIYFASLGGVDATGGGTGEIVLYNCTLFDPSGVPGTSACSFDASAIAITLQECRIDCSLAYNGVGSLNGTNPGVSFVNCYVLGLCGSVTSSTLVIGGVYRAEGCALTTVDGDAILCTPFSPVLVAPSPFGAQFGFVCLDSTLVQLDGGETAVVSTFYGGAVAYASETVSTVNFDVMSNGRLVYDPNATAAVTFTYPLAISTGIGMNGGTLASSEDGGTPTVINGGIATTVVNLDAPQGVGSFGGKAFLLGGGTIADFS